VSSYGKKIPLSDLKKSEQIVVRSGKSNFIDKLIFPNPVTIGLDGDLRSLLTTEGGIKINSAVPDDVSETLYNSGGDLYFSGEKILRSGANSKLIFDDAKSLLKITGSIDLSDGGTITCKNFVGSITSLADGSQYIRSGEGISITTGSSGQLTISAAAIDTGIRAVVIGTAASNVSATLHGKTIILTDADGRVVTFTYDKNVEVLSPVRVGPAEYTIGCKGVTTDIQHAQGVESAINLARGNRDLLMSAVRILNNLTLTQVRPGPTGNTQVAGTAVSSSLIIFNNEGVFQGGSANNPAVAAKYLTLETSGFLDNERVLAPGLGISGNDAGANSAYTLSIDTNVVARRDAGNTFVGTQTFSGEIRGKHQKLASGEDAFVGGRNVQITNRPDGSIMISSTDNDTKYTAGPGLRLVGNQFSVRVGSGLSATPDGISINAGSLAGAFLSADALGKLQVNLADGRGLAGFDGNIGVNTHDIAGTGLLADGETIAVDPSRVAFLTGSEFSGPVRFVAGLSGSLTRLADGRSFIVAGDNVNVVTQSSGQVVISSSYVDTTYLPGPGLRLTETTFGVALKDHGGLAFDDTEVILDTQTVIGEGLRAGVAGLIAVDETEVAFLTGSTFTGQVDFTGGLRGSHTQLADGSSFIVAGDNITVVTASNGSIVIASTASGSATVAGSTGDVQINISGSLGVADGFFYDAGQSTLHAPEISCASITGSLTRLSSGAAFITSGPNITITTGSDGQITVSASPTTFVSARSRFVHVVTASISAAVPVVISGVDFSKSLFLPNLIDVTCNGSLLFSGSEAEVLAGDADYFIDSVDSIKFSFDLVPHDVLQAMLLASGTDTMTMLPGGAPGAVGSVQFNDAGNFGGDTFFTYDPSTLSLSAPSISGSLTCLADGSPFLNTSGSLISVATASNGSILIQDSFDTAPIITYDDEFQTAGSRTLAGSGPIELVNFENQISINLRRTKTTLEIEHAHEALEELTMPGVDFSAANFDDDRIDVYVNGQLLSSGSDRDYELAGTANTIRLSFALQKKDIIVAHVQ